MAKGEPGFIEDNISGLVRAAHSAEAAPPPGLAEELFRALSAAVRSGLASEQEFAPGIMGLLLGELGMLAVVTLVAGVERVAGPGGRAGLPVWLVWAVLGGNLAGIPVAAATIILRRLAHVR